LRSVAASFARDAVAKVVAKSRVGLVIGVWLIPGPHAARNAAAKNNFMAATVAQFFAPFSVKLDVLDA
jgi:hypothetical protein